MRADGECRACHEPIRWVITRANGVRLPIDPKAVPDGNVWIIGTHNGLPLVDMALHADQVPRSEPLRYVPHQVTCAAGRRDT